MKSFVALLGLAVVLFLSTNVDDLVVLVAFFANARFRARDVVAGQYAGVAGLFIVSVAGALLTLAIPKAYLGLLGIFPIVVGIRKLLEFSRDDRAEADPTKAVTTGSYGNIASVALVTVANGGDNIGVYIPAFAVHSASQVAIIAVVFVAMTALLCLLAHGMVSHPGLGAPLRRYGHILGPAGVDCARYPDHLQRREHPIPAPSYVSALAQPRALHKDFRTETAQQQPLPGLELHHKVEIDKGLISPQIGEPGSPILPQPLIVADGVPSKQAYCVGKPLFVPTALPKNAGGVMPP